MIDAVRLRLLEAMGVDVYALRTRAAAVPAAPIQDADSESQPSRRLLIVCSEGVRGDARLSRLFKHLPQTLGVGTQAIDWLEAGASGDIAAAADAPAYLVFGAAMARALGVQLSTMQQSTATIAVTAEPARLPGSAADKRALWQTLKPIARRLRGAAD